MYGASPLDNPDGGPQAPPAPTTAALSAAPSVPVGDALAKFGSRVSLGLSSLFAEAGQVLKTVVTTSPQHIPVGHGAPPTPDFFAGSDRPARKPSTVMRSSGAGLAARMGARLDDVLRALEVEVACLADCQVRTCVRVHVRVCRCVCVSRGTRLPLPQSCEV